MEAILALVIGGYLLIVALTPLFLLGINSRLRSLEDRQLSFEAEQKRGAASDGKPGTESKTEPPPPPPPVDSPDREPSAMPDPAFTGGPPEAPAPPSRISAEPPSPPPPFHRPPTGAAAVAAFEEERSAAERWLGWLGGVALLFGLGFFLKYIIEIGLIGPTARVVFGMLGGAAAFAGGAWAMRRDYSHLGMSLAGFGLGAWFLSIYAAHHWYGLVPLPAGFAGLAVAAAIALAFATWANAQPVAFLALIGGYLAPILMSTGVDRQAALFSYLLILNVAVLAAAGFRKWRPTEIFVFVASALMWSAWLQNHYGPAKLIPTLQWLTAYFVLFAALGIWHHLWRRRPLEPSDTFLIMTAPLLYSAVALSISWREFGAWHGWFAVAMAVLYLGLWGLARLRSPDDLGLRTLLFGIASTFATLALPMFLTPHWTLAAWSIEATVLLSVGFTLGSPRMRALAWSLLGFVASCLTFLALRAAEEPLTLPMIRWEELRWHVVSIEPIWNGRALSFAAAIFAAAYFAWEYRRRPRPLAAGEPIDLAPPAAILLVPVLLLAAVSVESHAWFTRYQWHSAPRLATFIVELGSLLLGTLVAGLRLREIVLLRAFGVGTAFWGMLVALNLLLGFQDDPDFPYWHSPHSNPRLLAGYFAFAACLAAGFIVRRAAAQPDSPFAAALRRDAKELAYAPAMAASFVVLTLHAYLLGNLYNLGAGRSLGITCLWATYAMGAVWAGLARPSQGLRQFGLLLFLVTAIKVFIYDIWRLDPAIRYIAFTALGVALLAASFLYRRLAERLRGFLSTDVEPAPESRET
ncbi:MAG TPA: DUF2339 domain-containing protein [Planctomycetia bacterium]|nr:DUF2339 domain-containing protein [Planctomycetia bacterium]